LTEIEKEQSQKPKIVAIAQPDEDDGQID